MSKQTRDVAIFGRLRRNRFVAITIVTMCVMATATFAGIALINSGGVPMLTVVGDFDQPTTLKTHVPTARAQKQVTPVSQDNLYNVNDSATSEQEEEIRWFNNRPIRAVGTMTMTVTAYSPDERSCGKWADGITASGYSVWTNGMNLVAADESILPFGSLVSVPGYDNGDVVPVLDRGGAIKGKRLDVLYATHERAMQWGVQKLEVTIWEYADGQPNGFRQNHRRRR
jgi:3D (Asp-Asp-Asp) domain-containing protein